MGRHNTRGPDVRYAAMRLSQYPISTLKEVPADAEVISHQLMLRAGMIRRLAAGLYVWLPMGLAHPAEGRAHRARGDGPRRRPGAVHAHACSLRSCGRNPAAGPSTARSCCASRIGTTVSSPTARRTRKSSPTSRAASCAATSSCRSISIRFNRSSATRSGPRFGVMRAREFLMKDAYSFHIDEPSLAQGYRAMYDAYSRIFTRMGLQFRAVQADGGSIGGSVSQEFHVLADSGEDAIAFSNARRLRRESRDRRQPSRLASRARRRRSRCAKYATPECAHHRRAVRISRRARPRNASRPCWWTAATATWSH